MYTAALPINWLWVGYKLPYIYTAVLITSINLFFNPLGYSLFYFNTGYILAAVLSFTYTLTTRLGYPAYSTYLVVINNF